MVPKPDHWIAAKHVDERELLAACLDHEAGGPHPKDVLPSPPKTTLAKIKKLQKRGLLRGLKVTPTGREAMRDPV